MDLKKAKEVNKEIIKKACDKIEVHLNEKTWGKEEFEVFSQALDNLRDIEKIEKLEREEEREMTVVTAPILHSNEYDMSAKKPDVTKVTTDFEQLIYDISEKHKGKDGMIAITTILADHMEDIKLFNRKMYDMVMMKLKNMLY